MRVADFDYELPPELIAQTPLEPRDSARLLVLDKRTGSMAHHIFHELPSLLRAGDCLIANDSRVIPARLLGHKPSGGALEILLLKRLNLTRWETLARPARRFKTGATAVFGNGELTANAVAETPAGGRIVEFTWQGSSFEAVLDHLGRMPLPPYITQELADPERYQTVYSRNPGSAAAPTAGLHFTPDLLRRLNHAQITIAYITLHVGLGTFRPVQEEQVEDHLMHAESYLISPEAAATINAARQAGRRIIAVGTTSARALEAQAGLTAELPGGYLTPGGGETSIFIYPGYIFRIVDGLITNFHLPKSTLLMLVSALAGREHILQAYATAVEQRYRFFSFGDAMLIL